MDTAIALTVIPLERLAARFVQCVPIHFARRHGLLGLDTDDPQVVEIVTDVAAKQALVDNLGLTLGCEVRLVIAERESIRRAIELAYQQQTANVQAAIEDVTPAADVQVETPDIDRDLLDNAARAPVVKLVNLLLCEAVRKRASDIHVQPLEDDLVIRLRIDGLLYDFARPGLHLHDELVARIKVMAGLDIAEKRLAQDGRATVRIGTRVVDLRIATLPTGCGERVVLRLLDKSARRYELRELGMAEDVCRQFEALIRRSHGLLLMTGPTGSGKSTTLYAALQRVDSQHSNVLTLEDPIEYHLPGISQTQVNERKGLTFATGLRHLLRQDPDVIMVGEIRDEATARLAVQSALTGHLVLSTLHTNDAAGAVARLLDLGIEPYLVADALLAAGAQRLVRLNCSQCREVVPIDPQEAAQLELDSGTTIYRGIGCDTCGGTGFYERQGVFELLVMDDNLRALTQRRAQAAELRAATWAAGLRTLRQDGVQKVLAGRTTPAEVLRVTPGM